MLPSWLGGDSSCAAGCETLNYTHFIALAHGHHSDLFKKNCSPGPGLPNPTYSGPSQRRREEKKGVQLARTLVAEEAEGAGVAEEAAGSVRVARGRLRLAAWTVGMGGMGMDGLTLARGRLRAATCQ